MLKAALYLLVLLSGQSQGFNEIPPGQKYEVVFPRKLHAQHKRDVQSEYPDLVQYGIEVNGQPMVLHLEKTEDLISENYTETHYLNDGSPLTTSPEIKDHCFYQGYVKNDNSSQVTLSACNGLSGIITAQENKFLIQPLNMSDTGAHAVYEYQTQDSPKTCGVGDKNDNETIIPKIDYSSSNQEKEAFLRSRKYIEMYIVADNSMFRRFNGREDDIRRRIFGIVNFVNQVYRPLNIFVALNGMESWNHGNQFEVVTDADTNLDRFSEWRKEELLSRKPHDNAQLLTNIDFDGTTVGYAFTGGMCSSDHSAGVIQDHSADYVSVAASLAHELGHNLGMSHDDHCCRSCIMAASTSNPPPRNFSSCSHQEYQKFILEHKPLCMINKPKMEELWSDPVCGNKFRERGEECDCGSEEECTDQCCDPATCKLKQGAQCSEEDACCSVCQLKPAGSVCRPAKDDCDLSDMCDGRSAACPSDRFRMNGYSCHNGEGYCYNGKCPTFRSQCETYWGAGSAAVENSCYGLIKQHCRHSSYRYGQCGDLHCSGGSSKIIINGFGYCIFSACKILDSVLVESGTKCGNGTMCINGQCSAIPVSIQPADCAAKCTGNVVCDHELQCRCEEGWSGPNCDSKISNSSSRNIAHVIIPIIVIILLAVVALVLYKRFQKKKQRSVKTGSAVTIPIFDIQNQTPQKQTSYHDSQRYTGISIHPPQPPAQSQKPKVKAYQHPAAVPPTRPKHLPVLPKVA